MSADDIRQSDRHASWREVYDAMGVDPDGHVETAQTEGRLEQLTEGSR